MQIRFGLSIRHKIILGFAIPLSLIFLVSILLYSSNERQLEMDRWVDHTHLVISKSHELSTLSVDMETGERGFLITGKLIFLEPYDIASYLWPIKLAELIELLQDNPSQVDRLIEINKLQQEWITHSAEKAIKVRSNINNNNIAEITHLIKLVETQGGKSLTDRIRAIINEFIQVEHNIMEKRRLEEAQAVSRTKQIFLFGGVSAIISAILITLYISSHVVRNLHQLVRKANEISKGDLNTQVEVNSEDEFSLLAKSFNSMTASLKESTKKLELAVKVKTDFLANMSHEIRTPMNGILGMLTLLEDTHLTKLQTEYTDNIRSCGDGLLVVINDILDVSKLESGKLSLEEKPFDLLSLINESCFVLDSITSNKGLSISQSIDHKLPDFLIGDRMRIKQVLLNLLSNAVKFTREGAVELHLRVNDFDDGRCSFTIDIIDQGIGISVEDLDKLFKPFSQVDNSTTREYEGTGLGLTICAQLVKQMSGKISVSSEEGKGSTFTVQLNLPVDSKRKVASTDNVNLVANEGKKLAEEIPLTILLAEDNRINQLVAKKLFNKLGYTVDLAVNGEEAVKAAKEKSYDIIFMDMQMPVMDGVTATKEILNDQINPHLKIIAMTANVLPQDKKRCYDAGMIGFVGKPIHLDDIVREIRSVLS